MDARIALITLVTDQVAAMHAFYRDGCGFAVKLDLGGYVEFESEGVRFAVCDNATMHQATGDDSYNEPQTGHAFELAFPCESREDVDASFERLVAHGARPIRRPAEMPWGQYTGFFADPAGNLHEVFFAPPDEA